MVVCGIAHCTPSTYFTTGSILLSHFHSFLIRDSPGRWNEVQKRGREDIETKRGERSGWNGGRTAANTEFTHPSHDTTRFPDGPCHNTSHDTCVYRTSSSVRHAESTLSCTYMLALVNVTLNAHRNKTNNHRSNRIRADISGPLEESPAWNDSDRINERNRGYIT